MRVAVYCRFSITHISECGVNECMIKIGTLGDIEPFVAISITVMIHVLGLMTLNSSLFA